MRHGGWIDADSDRISLGVVTLADSHNEALVLSKKSNGRLILISTHAQKSESVRGKKTKKNPVKLLIFQVPKNATNKQMVQALTDQMIEEIRGNEKPKKKKKKKE